jgi:hypothetical protein
VNPDGSYVFFIRLGSKSIELEKGKNAIAVPSLDKIPRVIDILITAVRNGELDDQLAHAKKPPTAVRSAQAGDKSIPRPCSLRTMREYRAPCGGNAQRQPSPARLLQRSLVNYL